MIMWTNQPYVVYEQLRQTGIFRCDPKQSDMLDDPECLMAYQWMVAQMKKRIGLPPAALSYRCGPGTGAVIFNTSGRISAGQTITMIKSVWKLRYRKQPSY